MDSINDEVHIDIMEFEMLKKQRALFYERWREGSLPGLWNWRPYLRYEENKLILGMIIPVNH